MVNILLMGHGHFASGICNTLKLLGGDYKNLISIDFNQRMAPNDLMVKMNEEIDKLPKNKGLLIFTDIPGGTPFKKGVEYKLSHDDVEVIAGTNIPMLMEVLFLTDTSLEAITHTAIKFGKRGIVKFTEKQHKEGKANSLGI